jgi:hypothetical protein
VEEDVLKDDPTFKCSRCSHIFAYDRGSEEPGPIPSSSASEERDEPAASHTVGRSESLSFTFGEHDSRGVTDAVDPGENVSSAAGAAPEDDDFVFREEDDGPVEEEGSPPPEDRLDEPRFVRGEDELRVESESKPHPERPYLVFVVLLALLFANFALYLRNHPAEAARILARIPIAGRMLTEDRLLQTRIHLGDVEGVYQRIKDDRLVFIVSGRATNTSSQPLKGIQIESTLYGDSGDALDSKSIYCGNAMSLKIVKDLSSKEISLLQRLEPPQRFEIQPGESAGFTVVFMTPPGGLKQFSARVVAAQQTLS